jgi:YVTN family beta-propeller protein
MGITPDGQRLYVANGKSNSISVIDTGKMAVIQEVPVGEAPWGVVVH